MTFTFECKSLRANLIYNYSAFWVEIRSLTWSSTPWKVLPASAYKLCWCSNQTLWRIICRPGQTFSLTIGWCDDQFPFHGICQHLQKLFTNVTEGTFSRGSILCLFMSANFWKHPAAMMRSSLIFIVSCRSNGKFLSQLKRGYFYTLG